LQARIGTDVSLGVVMRGQPRVAAEVRPTGAAGFDVSEVVRINHVRTRNPDDPRVEHLLTAVKPVRHGPPQCQQLVCWRFDVSPDDVLNCEIAGIVDEADHANVAT